MTIALKTGHQRAIEKDLSLKDLTNKSNHVRLTVDLPREEHTKLKIYAIQQGQKIKEVVLDCIKKLEMNS